MRAGASIGANGLTLYSEVFWGEGPGKRHGLLCRVEGEFGIVREDRSHGEVRVPVAQLRAGALETSSVHAQRHQAARAAAARRRRGPDAARDLPAPVAVSLALLERVHRGEELGGDLVALAGVGQLVRTGHVDASDVRGGVFSLTPAGRAALGIPGEFPAFASFAAPRPAEFHLEHIARGLSSVRRWCGHTREPITVAQHSVLVARDVYQLLGGDQAPAGTLYGPEVRWGLLHDAAEAYLSDVPSPVKALCPDYAELEARWLRALAERFDLPSEIPEVVHEADMRLRDAEAVDLRGEALERPSGIERIRPVSAGEAAAMFLREARMLEVPHV